MTTHRLVEMTTSVNRYVSDCKIMPDGRTSEKNNWMTNGSEKTAT